MPVYVGYSKFVRTGTGPTGPTGPRGLTGPAGISGAQITGPTGHTGSSFHSFSQSSSGLTFTIKFNEVQSQNSITAITGGVSGDKLLGNTGNTIVDTLAVQNFGTGFTLGVSSSPDESKISVRSLAVNSEYLSISESDDVINLNYDISGTGYLNVIASENQLIKANASGELVGLSGATASEGLNQHTIEGFSVRSVLEPSLLLGTGDGLSADIVAESNGLKVEIDWTKAKTFVVRAQDAQIEGNDTNLVPIIVNIAKPPTIKSASFFLVVEGATGTPASVDRFTSTDSEVKFPFIRKPCFSGTRDIFTFISVNNVWYGNLVHWDNSSASLVSYDEAHRCNESDLVIGGGFDETGVCCFGNGNPRRTGPANCPGFFVPDYISNSFGFFGDDTLNVCGTLNGPVNLDAVGPCCQYNELIDPLGIDGLGVDPDSEFNDDIITCNELCPEECLNIGRSVANTYTAFSGFNDYIPVSDPNAEPGCDQVDCINSIFDKGACCDGQGNCTEISQYVCNEIGGFYRGRGIKCTDTLCSGGTGSCCTFGQCVDGVTGPDCIAAGSKYAGEGTNCQSVTCPSGLSPDTLHPFFGHPDVQGKFNTGEEYGGGVVTGLFNPLGSVVLGNPGFGVNAKDIQEGRVESGFRENALISKVLNSYYTSEPNSQWPNGNTAGYLSFPPKGLTYDRWHQGGHPSNFSGPTGTYDDPSDFGRNAPRWMFQDRWNSTFYGTSLYQPGYGYKLDSNLIDDTNVLGGDANEIARRNVFGGLNTGSNPFLIGDRYDSQTQEIIDVFTHPNNNSETLFYYWPQSLITNSRVTSKLYRASYDYHGYGFDDRVDASYFDDNSIGLPAEDDVREDGWFIIVALNDAELDDGTKQFKWGVTGSNFAPIDNGRYEIGDPLDDIGDGGTKNIFRTKEGFYRRTRNETSLYLSGWPAMAEFASADTLSLPGETEEIQSSKPMFENSATTYLSARSAGQNTGREKLIRKYPSRPEYFGGQANLRSEFGPDMNGLYHRNWGLYNTIRMAWAIDAAYGPACESVNYPATPCSNRENVYFDYGVPGIFSGIIRCPDLQNGYTCGCEISDSSVTSNGTTISCDSRIMATFDPAIMGLTSYDGLLEYPNVNRYSNGRSFIEEYENYYNGPRWWGQYWFGKIESVGSKDSEPTAKLSSVHAIRTKFDDRLHTEGQPCPENYCDPDRNWIYPNPPMLSPWYLPSPDEMAYIARKIALEGLNEKIVEAGGDPISGEYWTSMASFNFIGKLDTTDDITKEYNSLFANLDVRGFTAELGSGWEGPNSDWNQSEIDRWNDLHEAYTKLQRETIIGQATHLADPEGLLFTGTTGATTGIGTGPYTGFTGTSPYVGIKVPRNDGRIQMDGKNEIKGHMTKAWAMKIPEVISNDNPTSGFSMKKLSKAEDTAKVRPIRLIRADGRYPIAGYDSLDSSLPGFNVDKHFMMWYMPYIFNTDEPFADPEVNKYQFVLTLTNGVTGPGSVWDSSLLHRGIGSPEAIVNQQGLQSNLPDIFGSCTLASGYCFETNRYDCQNFYAGKYAGDGTRCPQSDIRTSARRVKPTDVIDDPLRFLRAYLNNSTPRTDINNPSGNRSSGSQRSSSGTRRSSGGSSSGGGGASPSGGSMGGGY